MEEPPIPPLEHLAEHSFSFFPAIVGIEHNEWLLHKATWSEVLVSNCGTQQELWIPRRYFGEVSRVEDPVLIAGLTQELEYKAGMLRPHHRRLLEMPSAAVPFGNDTAAVGSSLPEPKMGSRLESSDKRVLKLIGLAVALFVGVYLLAVNYLRIGNIRQETRYTMKDQSFLALSPRDDRFAIVSKIGNPASDHTKEIGTIQYEALGYPDRRYTVILMGRDAKELAYIGTVDDRWHPVHYVSLRSGGSTDSLLRALEKF